MESWLWGWFIGIIVALIIQYFIAREFQRIAELKGHYEKRYFLDNILLMDCRNASGNCTAGSEESRAASDRTQWK